MLLDTDVLIDLESKHPAARAWIDTLPVIPAVCGFAAMELLNGCLNNTDRRKVETFLRPFPVLWPSEAALSWALSTFTPLRLAHGLGMIDALIATTALDHRRALVTFNVRHFRAVPGLITVQPYTH
jgi:predicted nucleic acid-binding protein